MLESLGPLCNHLLYYFLWKTCLECVHNFDTTSFPRFVQSHTGLRDTHAITLISLPGRCTSICATKSKNCSEFQIEYNELSMKYEVVSSSTIR